MNKLNIIGLHILILVLGLIDMHTQTPTGGNSPKIETVTFLQVGNEQPTPIWIDVGPIRMTVTVSTGTYRTLMSSAVYERMIAHDDYQNLKLEPVTNIRLQDMARNPLKIRGSIRLKCRVVSFVGGSEIPLELDFLVVESLKPDGILGSKDLFSSFSKVILAEGVIIVQQAPQAIALVGSNIDPKKALADHCPPEE